MKPKKIFISYPRKSCPEACLSTLYLRAFGPLIGHGEICRHLGRTGLGPSEQGSRLSSKILQIII